MNLVSSTATGHDGQQVVDQSDSLTLYVFNSIQINAAHSFFPVVI